ncbi:hypothetical protein [Roseibium alexandrii]|uniref:Uncharacterized protein n=1 Tax=Roseibium alexandrii (strain DSM 17067 / NCIMB 14079 / DFL-11) TaxID=244592 RepID=A0A5E8H527_ROSAD|nr:hypothetical protein [Roseibium alexandrii]EEE47132.2 hypothetical protein SADFL11_4421 [Roseibium alexandrii DFL-11]
MEWILLAACLYFGWRFFFRKKSNQTQGAEQHIANTAHDTRIQGFAVETQARSAELTHCVTKEDYESLVAPFKDLKKNIRKTHQKAKRFLAANDENTKITKAKAEKLLTLLAEIEGASEQAAKAHTDIENLDINNGVYFSDALDRQRDKFAESFDTLYGDIEETSSEIFTNAFIHFDETGQLSLYTQGKSDEERVIHALEAILRDR